MADRASIRDVARLASVSRQTVSRALNEPDSVSPDTLQRVRDAVAALGYRPNPAARSLRTRQSGVVGVVVNPMSWFALDQEVARLGHLSADRGLALQIAATYDDSYEGARAAIGGLLDQRVEGIFVMSPHDRALDVALSIARQTPVVIVQSGTQLDDGVGTVDSDQVAGVRLMVEHLVALGHRRIEHISGPRTWVSARVRTEAWLAEVERHGIETRMPFEGNFRPESGLAAGAKMVARGLPDAVFASSDLMAQGVIRAFVDAGFAVPRDVSVAGYDDVLGTATYVPRLTTVRQPLTEICAQAIDIMAAMIDGEPARQVVLEPQLMARESVARKG